MMEEGDGNKYRGKNMDEININVNELISNTESTDAENEKPEIDTNKEYVNNEPINSTTLLPPTPQISCAHEKPKPSVEKMNHDQNFLNTVQMIINYNLQKSRTLYHGHMKH